MTFTKTFALRYRLSFNKLFSLCRSEWSDSLRTEADRFYEVDCTKAIYGIKYATKLVARTEKKIVPNKKKEYKLFKILMKKTNIFYNNLLHSENREFRKKLTHFSDTYFRAVSVHSTHVQGYRFCINSK